MGWEAQAEGGELMEGNGGSHPFGILLLRREAAGGTREAKAEGSVPMAGRAALVQTRSPVNAPEAPQGRRVPPPVPQICLQSPLGPASGAAAMSGYGEAHPAAPQNGSSPTLAMAKPHPPPTQSWPPAARPRHTNPLRPPSWGDPRSGPETPPQVVAAMPGRGAKPSGISMSAGFYPPPPPRWGPTPGPLAWLQPPCLPAMPGGVENGVPGVPGTAFNPAPPTMAAVDTSGRGDSGRGAWRGGPHYDTPMSRRKDGTPFGAAPQKQQHPGGRREAEGLQDGAAEPLGSSDPLFDWLLGFFFSVPVPAAPVLGAAQSPASHPSGFFFLKAA